MAMKRETDNEQLNETYLHDLIYANLTINLHAVPDIKLWCVFLTHKNKLTFTQNNYFILASHSLIHNSREQNKTHRKNE